MTDPAKMTIRDMLDLIVDLTDASECWFDHHGYCQAHGWMATTPSCPHGRSKALLARADAEGVRASRG